MPHTEKGSDHYQISENNNDELIEGWRKNTSQPNRSDHKFFLQIPILPKIVRTPEVF